MNDNDNLIVADASKGPSSHDLLELVFDWRDFCDVEKISNEDCADCD